MGGKPRGEERRALRLALLGDPVAHSLSPVIHAAALEAAGIAGTYAARRVDAAGLAEAVDQLRAGSLDGANVTMPHKQLAATLCDEQSAAALRAGSVNTLSFREGEVFGDTTDVQGVRLSWQELPPEPVLVLGAGGAAAAALLALEGREIYATARKASAIVQLIDGLQVRATTVEWGKAIPDAVVLNATPLGMNRESLPSGLLPVASGLFDMAYGPAPTPAVSEAAQRGIPFVDGRKMLVAQAAVSFRIWTGAEASTEAMAAALG